MDDVTIIEKARAGVYKDNPKNRKLGRVGARYGTSKTVEEYYAKTVAHFKSYSDTINRIAKEFDAIPLIVPPKKLDRVKAKTENEYGGNFFKVKDILRSTIVVSRSNAEKLCDEIRQKFDCVKAYVNFSSEGYQGANFVFIHNNFPVELQVNTPVNIALKQDTDIPALKNTYEMINNAGIPTGLGHRFYEKLRDPGISEATNTVGTNLMTKYYNYREMFLMRDEINKGGSKHGKGKKRKPITVYNKKTGKTYVRNQLVGSDLEKDEMHHPISEFLDGLAKLTSGRQQKFYEWERDKARFVEISKINTLPEETRRKIEMSQPKVKECYGNSARIVMTLGDGVKYVEGFVSYAGVIPLEHAWVKIGDKYYDATAEGPLKGASDMGHYTSIIELDEKQVMEMMYKEEKHGPWVGPYYYRNVILQKSLLPWASMKIAKAMDALPENICKSSDDQTFKEYADCIIVNGEGKLLLLMRADGDYMPRTWCLPGGKVENGETIDQGALRELLEETNIQPTGYNFLQTFDNADGTSSHYYEVHTSDEQIMVLNNNEHYNWRWVDQSDLNVLPLMLNLKERLEKLLPETTFGTWSTNPFGYTSIITDTAANISPEATARRQKEDAAYFILKTAYDNGQLSEAEYLTAASKYSEIKKGRPAQVGDIREWGGRKMQKTANGWIPVQSGKKDAKPEEEGKEPKGQEQEPTKEKNFSEEELAEHAQNASESDLKKTISNSKDENLRVAAKKELQRRKEQSDEIEGKNQPEEDNTDKWAKPDEVVAAEQDEKSKSRFAEKAKAWHAKQVEFYQSDAVKPDSPERRDLAELLRNKAKGIVKSIKHEVHEFEHAGSGLKKLFTGNKDNVTPEEYSAMKQIAIHSAMVIGTMALTAGVGGLVSAGAGSLAKGFALHYLEHAGLMRIGHALAFAKSEDEDLSGMTSEQAIERLIKEMIDYIQHADISEDDLERIGDNSASDFTTIAGDEENDTSSSDETFNQTREGEDGDQLEGGLADGKTVEDIAEHHSVEVSDIEKQLEAGTKVEMEHVDDDNKAKEIALDHLYEDPKYYDKLKEIEKAED